jgi:hypothetical protein
VPLAAWVVVVVAVTLLLLHDGLGPVTNSASVLTGRPIALTARGRELAAAADITPEQRRQSRLMALTALGIVVVAFLLVIL